jgi:hypothetical protein
MYTKDKQKGTKEKEAVEVMKMKMTGLMIMVG